MRRNRVLKWRDQEIPEGRILTVVVVPNELVNDLLAISGKHGLIIDLARRDIKEKHELECANVRLPEEWGIKEALKKHEEMPKKPKDVSKGIVPTRRGFALRVSKAAEGEVIAFLNPNEAIRLGPAMGLTPKSSWVIKGVPAYADTGVIVKTIAQTSGSWLGWVVRPKRPLTTNRGRVTTWLVDAVVEPPSAVITFNGLIINIEKNEETSPNKKAGAWMNISPKLGHEIIPGRIFEDGEGAGAKDESDRVDSFANVVKQGRPKGGANDVDMTQNGSREDRATKRRIGTEDEAQEAESEAEKKSENTQMLNKLLDKLDQKDRQIDQMLATIEGLRGEIRILSERLRQMQTGAANEDKDI